MTQQQLQHSTKQQKNGYTCLLILLFAFAPVHQLWAQLGATSLSGPGIGISVDYLPASRYIRPEDSVKTNSTTSQQRYNFAAAFMLSNRVDTATGKVRNWGLAVSGSYTKLQNKDYEHSLLPEELLSTQLVLTHYRSLHNRWGMLSLLSVGLYTDMEKMDMEDIFINGGVLFIKQHNRHFSYGIGAMLTNSFGTPMVLPALLVKWQTDSKFKIDINFPEKLSVSKRMNSQTDLALAFRMRGSSYDVENGPDKKRLMGYSEMSLGLENTWHLNKHIDFVASGGSILYSGFTFQNKKLSEMFSDKPMHRMATNYFFSGGLRWNFQARK
ncbi:DUF6268 family outer membrane beta-barrel protein [Chitinophaga arvensicola]|uniref:DUF6268 domain-containing protein n=1 Tax=Chitinophaga arvensicola TaxID=29529 RepID=A0A1I0S5G4_9BACT|nr:DUF6268 family outer membrane beta-barrel protein [Chitinophaga arvensicola]SEW50079.1 hypothetical protein SAMN04488122_3679 [Chitinophaga arvensicola]